ncbi:MAG: hypothetical protein NUW23_13440 [Firmicutes bacterium]|nr:hypothetical protein [Bacillota bacterium]
MHRPTILEVDLSSKTSRTYRLSPELARRYLGGPGLGIYLLRYMDPTLDPVVFCPGLLVGFPVLGCCKTTVMARSPLTGILGESSASARWGMYLKRLGYDALVLVGRADRLSIVRVEHGSVEVDDGSRFALLDIPEFDSAHRDVYGAEYEPARIASAAERDVLVAGIVLDEEVPRYAARCGLGAALARMGVKGISVRRTPSAPVPAGDVTAANRTVLAEVRERSAGLAKAGTAGGVEYRNRVGDLPIKNWREGLWEGARVVNGHAILASMSGRSKPCFTCPIGCTKLVTPTAGDLAGKTVRSPEYETTAGFGPMCMCDDPLTVVEANELCDTLGLDTISVSAIISFVMELWERDIIDRETLGEPLLTQGVVPEWGSREAILGLIRAIARREGIGDLLALGSREAARQIGGDAPRYAMHVRGLEVPYHDPRCFSTIAATYATAARGASHNESLSYYVEQGMEFPEFGLAPPRDPEDPKGKGRIASDMQELAVLYDAIGLCKFMMQGRIQLSAISRWIDACLGDKIPPEELREIASRVITAKRVYGMEVCGMDPAEDGLPERIQNEPRPSGGAAGRTVPLREILEEYYQARGFEPDGRPSEETMKRLGLA